jgi:ACR3 family arsenite efflux pump ArsB
MFINEKQETEMVDMILENQERSVNIKIKIKMMMMMIMIKIKIKIKDLSTKAREYLKET